MKKNLLLTGNPGVGKTTLLMTLVERFRRHPVTGFYTEEIREAGERVGFRAVTLDGSSAVFAHKDYQTDPHLRVGRYGVEPEVLDSLVLPHLEPERKNARLVFVDEIAKMELLSSRFKEQVWALLDSAVPVVATISFKGTGFIKHAKSRADAKVMTVTYQNRNVLGGQLVREIEALLAQELPR